MGIGFKKLYNKLVYYFIPKSVDQGVDELRSTRIRISILLLTALLYLLFIPNAISLYPIQVAYIHIIVSIVIVGLLFLYRNGLETKWVAHGYSAAVAVAVYGDILYMDGLLNYAGALLLPVTAILVGNSKNGKLWFRVTILFLTVLYLLTHYGYKDFVFLEDVSKMQLNLFTGSLGALAALYYSIRVFENEKSNAIQDVLAANEKLEIEQKKSDALLLNILPEEVASELKETGVAKAKLFTNVSIVFTDFVNFTKWSEQLGPTELVNQLNKAFTGFDAIMEKNNLEKIKTIGDAYLAVCGLPIEDANHAEKAIVAAQEMIEFLRINDFPFEMRIGINSGEVVAGIVGVKKYAYDIWGDAVNTAARMEQNSERGKINISSSTYALVKDKYKCTYRGKIEAKNKGSIDMYFVD